MSNVATQQHKLPATIRERLADPRQLAELAKAMPKHCSAERMARVALTAIQRIPKLAECTQASFFKCLLDLSQWGLEPDGRRAHLIPFENRKAGTVECTLIIDYKGLVELAYRSGVVTSIHADVVRAGDVFRYSAGQVVEHVPHFLRRDVERPTKAGEVFAAYCVVSLRDGASKTEVMGLDEIDGIRRRSKAANSGPWVTDWTEMAKKTVFRRVTKWLPLSAEIRDAFAAEDEHEARPLLPERTADVLLASELEARLSAPLQEQEPEPESDPLAELREALAKAATAAEVNALCAAWAGPESTLPDAALCSEAERLCAERRKAI